MSDVKPVHCKVVLNRMEVDYAGSTIKQTYIAMGTMFRAAVSNDIIAKHPMDGVRYTKPVRAVSDIHFLTVEEQNKFLEAAKRSHNYRQYALLLETGLRTSEMIGLTWDSIKLEETYPDCQQNFGIQASDSCMEGGTTQDCSQLSYYSANR